MTTTGTPSTTQPSPLPPPRRAERASARTAFLAILRRDLFVTGKEFWVFLLQAVGQPLFILFVFAKVLGSLGYISDDYGDLLLPGVIAITAFLTALQSIAFPLVIEFSFTKEIEDRLLAPLPTWGVAVEKLVMASMRAIAAALLMLPIGWLVLGDVPWRAVGVPLFVGTVLLGSWVGAAAGLTLGTLVSVQRINVVFAAVLVPLTFTGAVQYPLTQLDDLRWFQVLSALNPLTYVSEGIRAAMVPEVPHVDPVVCIAVLTVWAVALTTIGVRGFLRRAID